MSLAAAIAHRTADAAPRVAYGVVEQQGSKTVVNVDGAVLSARWADPLVVRTGDAVLVLIAPGQGGQGTATVMCKVTTTPRPPEGTVVGVPGGSATITVDIAGASKSCRYLTGYSPVVGDLVALAWHSGDALVLGKVSQGTSSTNPLASPVAAPVQSVGTGISSFAASSSATWSNSAGGWSSYYGSDLTQGTWSGNTYSGAWFYGSGPKGLAGKTVTKFEIRVGARKYMGNYNDPLTLNLYRHTHINKGSTEPPRVEGPHSVVLGVNADPLWVTLPTDWGQDIAELGGGIAIAGGSYGGVAGRGADAESGLLRIHWSS